MKNFILLLLFFPLISAAQTREQQIADSIKYKKAAWAAFDRKDYKECIDDYTALIKLNPKNINAYANRASAKTYLNDNEGAIADYGVAAKLDDRYRWTYYNSIGNLKLSNDLKGAIDYYDKSISIYPSDGTFANRGNAWLRMGKYKRAIKDYTKAIDLQNIDTTKYHYNPTARSYHYTARAKAEALNGDFKGALADLNTSIRLKSGDTLTYNARGEAKNQLGDKAGACADWQTASKLGSKAANENIKKYCDK